MMAPIHHHFKKKGWAEQDPNYWWQCIEKCLITLKNRNNFDLVKSIGISYQMHGLVAINNKGEPLIPSIIWCDSRAVEIGKNAEKDGTIKYGAKALAAMYQFKNPMCSIILRKVFSNSLF